MTILNWSDSDLEKRESDLEHRSGLVLESAELTDRGAAILGRCHWLRELHLLNTGITDAGLKEISRLVDLEWLVVDDAAVTDEGIASLSSLEKLQGLQLMRMNRLTDRVFSTLEKFRDLEYLELLLAGMKGRQLSLLARLEKLGRVRISSGLPGDEQFLCFSDCRQLKSLVFDMVAVSQVAVDKLRHALNQCTVRRTFELSGRDGFVGLLRHGIELCESGDGRLARNAFADAVGACISHPAAYGVRALVYHFRFGHWAEIANDLVRMQRLARVTSNRQLYEKSAELRRLLDSGRLEQALAGGGIVEELIGMIEFPDPDIDLLQACDS